MKILRKILVLISVLLGVVSCDETNTDSSSSEIVEKKYIDCDISFANESGEALESKDFLINTNILVKVDFTFYNLDSIKDVVDFRVNLTPGVDTYSVYDYTEGPQEPKDVPHETDRIAGDDGIEKVIVISGMQFSIKEDIAKRTYHYIFTISGSKAHEDCEFKVIFSPQDSSFNEGKNKSFSKNYNFVENAKEQ